MDTAVGTKRKEQTHALEAGEEICTKRKKTVQTTPGRKRKERTLTLEEEEYCRQKRIDKAKIDVSFSKRRKGLFGKAARLCQDFDDTRLAVLVVSKARRPYAFAHSSVDEVLNDLYHVQPKTTKSAEGLKIMKKLKEQKKVMGLKEEIENEIMACQTVEGLASLREKYLMLDEDVKERLRYCSSEETSFEGGVRDLGSGYESSYIDLLSNGGIGQRDASIGNPLFASSESNYGVHDGGLTINGAIDGDGCSLGLWHDVGNTSTLRDPTTGSSDNFWLNLGLGHEVNGNSSRDLTTGATLCSTTSNYGVGGGLRLNGDTDVHHGCPLGLGLGVIGNFSGDSPTGHGNSSLRHPVPTTGISDISWPAASANYCVNDVGSELGVGLEVNGNSSGDSTTGHDVGNTYLRDSVPITGISDNCWPASANYCVNDVGLELGLGLGHEGSGDSSRDLTTGIDGNSLCSATSNYGVDGDLRLNGDINGDGNSWLWHEFDDHSLRGSTTDISSHFGEELRLNGDIDAEGCSLGLGLEVNGNSSGESATGFDFGDFDLDATPWPSPTNDASSDLAHFNTNKGYYSYLMEGDNVDST